MAFKKSGGQFFTPANGTYIGEFLGTEDSGVVFMRKDEETGEEKPNPQERWKFKLFKLNGDPVIDEKSGEQAVGDGLSSQSTGPNSKAREWTLALYGPDAQWDESADPNEFIAGAIGRKAMLTYGNNTQGKPGKLRQVVPYTLD